MNARAKMKAVVGLLLMLLRGSRGIESSCDGRQDETQCYGALGGAVDLLLVDNVSVIPRFNWKKNSSTILRWRNNSIANNTKESRFLFFPSNGTVRISNLIRTDSGEYILELFDKDGKSTGWRTLQLFVQALVSSVQLVPECLSQGQMKVSCRSEADSLQYNWTLDGHILTDSELFSRNTESNIIVLRQNISGRLVCSVRNQVSHSLNETIISGCGFIFINCISNGTQIAKWVYKENNTLCVEPTTVPPAVKHTSVGKNTQSNTSPTSPDSNDQLWYIKLLPVMAGVLAALVIVLVVGIAFICAHKKKKTTKVEEDDQDVTYVDVRIVKKRERKVEVNVADVEYGQVMFSKRPKSRLDKPNPTMDDTVYAQVRKGR
ncbi:uncharacterized protein LOC124860590 isoform X1 [Girardinichthys multiradiatus]|uniref:uncharacterized protein LOC124860590 isoform X1 n=1 Tax=Girardinichthys multiradiatus TaxID=208333 RepID=UPI001FABE95D|nr:uncharacterized protein LOC124860590 isoform X1 [Girardinichthys multiradiatus]